jgi:hypothetical protein
VGLPRRRGSNAAAHGAGGGAPPAKRVAIDPEMYTALTWDDLPAGVNADQLHAILQVTGRGRQEGGGGWEKVDRQLALHCAAMTCPSGIACARSARN